MKQFFVFIFLFYTCCCLAQTKERHVAKDGHAGYEMKETDGYTWFLIRDGGRCGAQDADGKEIIPLSRGYYDIVYHFGKLIRKDKGVEERHIPFFEVKKDLKVGLCDLTGKEIIEPKLERYKTNSGSMVYVSLYGYDINGFKYYTVRAKDNEVAYDIDGNLLFEPKYSFIHGRSVNGFDFFYVKNGDLEGVIDSHGRIIVEPKYNTSLYESKGFIRTSTTNQGFYILSNKLSTYSDLIKRTHPMDDNYIEKLNDIQSMVSSEKYEDAIKQCTQLLKANPTSYAYYYRGYSYYRSNKLDLAIEDLRYAVYLADPTSKLNDAVLALKEEADNLNELKLQAKLNRKRENSEKWDRILNDLKDVGQTLHDIGNSLQDGNSGNDINTNGSTQDGNFGGSSSDKKKQKCKDCLGNGKCSGAGSSSKYHCHGSGKCYACHGKSGKGVGMHETAGHYGDCNVCNNTGKCKYCNGTGKCSTCNGTGKI